LDEYTKKTKNWLDQQFSEVTKDGIYIAHQPIYGFRKGYCAGYIMNRYMITYHLMRALSHIHFKSLLDVGGAEGYKAALASSLFNVNARSSDLSEEVCKRAKDIYGIEGEPIDINNLPYQDESFDVVICSETLEHIPDIVNATKELIRVSKKAVVITVPREPEEIIRRNIQEKIPHAHLHALDIGSFDFMEEFVSEIKVQKILCPYLNIPSAIVESRKRKKDEDSSYSSLYISVFNFLHPIFKILFGKKTGGLLLRLDELLPRFTGNYKGMLFVLLKDQSAYFSRPLYKISPIQVIDFAVPFHFLDRNQVNRK
jgi:2-polyprenyl-3-methyl-5-hydroxy-6-metoxy-1,4-benzoquinol methylase